MIRGAVSNAKANGNAPPAAWTALLECAESAADGELDLDGGAPQVVALAERLVDLGLLRVPRASHYALTEAGKKLLGESRTLPALVRRRRGFPLLFPLSIVALAVTFTWLWLNG